MEKRRTRIYKRRVVEMENLFDIDLLDEENNDEAREKFKVKDLDAANWCFRKLKAIEDKKREIKYLADKEKQRIIEWEKEEEVMTMKDVESFLQISRSKAYEVVKSDNFPSYKVGSEFRILKSELIEWIKKQKEVS